MYEELYEPLPCAEEYLRRIGLGGEEIKAELSGLDRLVRAQLSHIPFDNMDVWGKGICPLLGIRALYEKIVLRRRGGYCFELNSLFNALLKALGFETYMVAAHVMAGRDEVGPPAHCALICNFSGEKYFCDVGYGGPVPVGGLPLSGESRFGFRLEKQGNYYLLCRDGAEELRFKDVPVDPVELIPMNYYISQKPDSPFRNILHLNLRLDEGSVSIVGREFKLRRGEERVEKSIEMSELPLILEEYFGISAEEASMKMQQQ